MFAFFCSKKMLLMYFLVYFVNVVEKYLCISHEALRDSLLDTPHECMAKGKTL